MTHYFVYQKGSLHKIENNNIPNKCEKERIKYVLRTVIFRRYLDWSHKQYAYIISQ